jgi:hypothetical protein
MADNFKDFNDEFDKFKRNLADVRKGAQEVEKGIGKWYEATKKIVEVEKDIVNTQKQIKASEEELKTLKKLRNKEASKLTEQEKKTLAVLKKQEPYIKSRIGYLKQQNKEQEKALENLKESVKEANKLKSIANSTKNFVKAWGWDKLRSYGVFDMDKEIRNASRSMALGSSQFDSFSKNLYSAADSTTNMGVGLKKLAALQGGYSKEIGRSVRLTEGGLKAMAGMAEGTGLGEQFAIGMAAAMDSFGNGAEDSAQMIEDTMNIAAEMGVNGQAASQALQKNLKLAQKYNFKGGVKALGKMSADALRLKLDMDGIASLADKVFRPEGAIEMAAQLSVMGGEFAKLGDPMTLMFKARNDMEGFAKDIGKATSEFVEFNKETGSFEVMGGLARDRMREISKMTGLSVEKLQEMAVQQKKIESIGSLVPVNFEDKDKEFISSVAKMKDGEFYINVDGKDQLVKNLEASQLKAIRNEKMNLEERAKAARTFEETVQDLLLTLKQTLVPVAKSLQEYLGKPLQELQKTWQKEGFYEKIRKFTEGAADIVSGLLGAGVKFAEFLGPGGTLATILGGSMLFKAASWIAAGRMLRMGFNMGGGFGGSGTPGGAGGGMMSPGFMSFGGAASNRGGSGFMKDYRSMAKGEGLGGKIRAARYASSMNRWGMGARMVSGMGLGLAGMGADYLRGSEDEEFYHSGAGKALGIGSAALKGASIGMMFGPWGALAGGLIGGGIGAYNEFVNNADAGNVGRRGPQATIPANDTIIEFNPRDKFMRVNDMLMASTSENQLKQVADKHFGNSNNSGSSEVKHNFGRIDGTIRFEGDGAEHLNNPDTQERLISMIAQRIAGNRNENKLTPNPQFG